MRFEVIENSLVNSCRFHARDIFEEPIDGGRFNESIHQE